MPESRELVRSALTPSARIAGGMLVVCLMSAALAASVSQVRCSMYTEASGRTTEVVVISGHELLCPTELPRMSHAVLLFWHILPGWAVFLSATISVILLFLGRCEDALISWVVTQLMFLLLLGFRVLVGIVSDVVINIFGRTDDFQWGYSIPIWIIGQGLLLGFSWLGTRPVPSRPEASSE